MIEFLTKLNVLVVFGSWHLQYVQYMCIWLALLALSAISHKKQTTPTLQTCAQRRYLHLPFKQLVEKSLSLYLLTSSFTINIRVSVILRQACNFREADIKARHERGNILIYTMMAICGMRLKQAVNIFKELFPKNRSKTRCVHDNIISDMSTVVTNPIRFLLCFFTSRTNIFIN